MARISKTGISNGGTIDVSHITRIIEALDGTGSADIYATGSFTGSFIGNGNGLTNVTASSATSASYALTASFLTGTIQSASYASTASRAVTASFATTASYIVTAQTASYSSKTNFLESNGYIANTTYGTQVFYATGSFTGSATSSLALINSVSNTLTGVNLFCYNLRTDIVGTYGDDIGTAKVIGGTLNATVKYNQADASVTIIGSITQVKNTDFTGTLPEFTYMIDVVGNQTQLNLKATGYPNAGGFPIKWTSVTYFTTGVASNVV